MTAVSVDVGEIQIALVEAGDVIPHSYIAAACE